MKVDIPWILLDAHFKGTISEENSNDLNLWLLKHSENKFIFDQLKFHFQKHGSLPLDFTPDTSFALKNLHTKIISSDKTAGSRRIIPLWLKVASILILCVFSYWSLRKLIQPESLKYIVISANDSTKLEHNLPDGSTIWLNARSKIRYTGNFKSSRTIYLIGEAYFEVMKDDQHPFQVIADKSVTTVVGTKFNIRSWLHENRIELTVNEGKVLFGLGNGNKLPLTRGQKGILNKSDNSLVTVINQDVNYLSWKTNDFYFESVTLQNVMQKLSDVYGFQFEIKDSKLQNFKLTAKFSQRPLSEIILTLEAVSGAEFIQSGNRFMIK